MKVVAKRTGLFSSDCRSGQHFIGCSGYGPRCDQNRGHIFFDRTGGRGGKSPETCHRNVRKGSK